MNSNNTIYFAEQSLIGRCGSRSSGHFYQCDRKICRVCISNASIYDNDKYYERLVKMFEKFNQVTIESIQENYIVCGKNLEMTKSVIIDEYDIDESQVIDQIEQYDEVEIIDEPQITPILPIVEELSPLPLPVKLTGKRTRDTFYIPTADDLTDEPTIEEPPRKLPKVRANGGDDITSAVAYACHWVLIDGITEMRKLYRNRIVFYEPLPLPIKM